MDDDGLAGFLRARLDEKQQFAEGLLESPPGVSGMRGLAEQMLREVGAGREILTAYIKVEAYRRRDDAWIAFRFAAETLAAVYSDHPDHRLEWEP